MRTDDAYELLDVRGERRIERFGDRVVSRPVPGAGRADHDRGDPSDLRYDRDTGWSGRTESWIVDWRRLRLELRPTEAGQVGLFPEHAGPLSDVATAPAPPSEVLNLFAYTGAGTLALASAGARVTHVDASRPAVAWARRNAELSGLADRPIRWIVDDAEAFVGREIRRGRRFDGVVLDPPTYGHGPGGRAWRVDDRLDPLLEALAVLTDGRPRAILLTSHTPGWTPDRLEAALRGAFRSSRTSAGELRLVARTGAVLPLGAWARIGPAA